MGICNMNYALEYVLFPNLADIDSLETIRATLIREEITTTIAKVPDKPPNISLPTTPG
jgi:hypothetical protein